MEKLKKNKIIIIIAFILVVVIAGSFILFDSQYKKFTLTAELTEYVFDTRTNIDEISDKTELKTELFRLIRNGVNVSKVSLNWNNDVVIYLSESQIIDWKNESIKKINEIREENIFVSDDYRRIIIETTEKPTSKLISTLGILDTCLFLQVLDGIPADQTYLELAIVKDGEQIYKVIWPEEENEFTYTEGTSKTRVQCGPSLD